MASTSTPPVFPCPYTAGGCPLFNTIEIPKPQTPSCAGGCSPPAATPSSDSTAVKLRPISPQRVPSPARLSQIGGELAAPYPRTPAPPSSSEAWSGYLEFGLQPSEVDLAPLYVPFPQPQAQTQPQASTSTKRSTSGGGLWDIEELVPETSSKKPRTLPLPPPPELPLPPLPRTGSAGDPTANGLTIPFDGARASPSSSEEGFANEVVTPFISKLNYLLEHQEYQPWIRWDATGTHILIAHTKPRLLEILASYFRHTTIASFVRQLNIYGFKRVTTVALLSILESTSLPHSILVPASSTSNTTSTSSSASNSPSLTTSTMATTETVVETFSASDYSAFHNPQFFKSLGPGSGGQVCRLGALKPITKERAPRNRSKKAKAEAAEKKRREAEEAGEAMGGAIGGGGDGYA